MNINEWAKEIHENAKNKGWWDDDREFPEILSLCHSELSEALEEYRTGRENVYYHCTDSNTCYTGENNQGLCLYPDTDCDEMNAKPEGIAVEMVDCIIRILDWLAKEEIDVEAVLKAKHEYNKTRPYRHGGKRC